MRDKFILEGKTPVPVDLETWARWLGTSKDRQVGYYERDGLRVSTVFLGLDHSFGGEKPLLFETMIFGGPHDQYQERYSTWDEAEAGHKKALELAGVSAR